MVNHTDFANDIFMNEKKIKGKLRVYYSLRKYKKMGYFKIIANISEHVNLVQLMNYLGNVNHAISVVGY